MDMNAYQAETAKTATYPEWASMQYLALGLAGEAGEVAEKIKKLVHASTTPQMFDDLCSEQQAARSIVAECGDVMWYIARIVGKLGYTLNECASVNLDKVARRVSNGTVLGNGDER